MIEVTFACCLNCWREASILALLDDALDIFGPERLLFASDWPMIVPYASYVEWAEAVRLFGHRRGLSATERDAVFGGNALDAHPRLRAALGEGRGEHATAGAPDVAAREGGCAGGSSHDLVE